MVIEPIVPPQQEERVPPRQVEENNLSENNPPSQEELEEGEHVPVRISIQPTTTNVTDENISLEGRRRRNEEENFQNRTAVFSNSTYNLRNNGNLLPNTHLPNIRVPRVEVPIQGVVGGGNINLRQRIPTQNQRQQRIRIKISRRRLQEYLNNDNNNSQELVLDFPIPNQFLQQRFGHNITLHPPNLPVITINDYIHHWLDNVHSFFHTLFNNIMQLNTNIPFKIFFFNLFFIILKYSISFNQLSEWLNRQIRIINNDKHLFFIVLSFINVMVSFIVLPFIGCFFQFSEYFVGITYLFLMNFLFNVTIIHILVKNLNILSNKINSTTYINIFSTIFLNIFMIYIINQFEMFRINEYITIPESNNEKGRKFLVFWKYFFKAIVLDFYLKQISFIIKSIVIAFLLYFFDWRKRVLNKGKYISILQLFLYYSRNGLIMFLWIQYYKFLKEHSKNYEYILFLLLFLFKLSSFSLVYSHFIKIKTNWNKSKFGRFIDLKKEEIEFDECVICKDKLKNPVKLECSHNFCFKCIKKWYKKKKNCPVCKKSYENLSGYFGTDGRTILLPTIF